MKLPNEIIFIEDLHTLFQMIYLLRMSCSFNSLTLSFDLTPVSIGVCCRPFQCPPPYPQHLQWSGRREQRACQTVTGRAVLLGFCFRNEFRITQPQNPVYQMLSLCAKWDQNDEKKDSLKDGRLIFSEPKFILFACEVIFFFFLYV